MLLRSFLVLGTLLLVAACSSVTVKPLSGSTGDLTGYSSYRWNLPPLDDADKYSADLVALDQAMRRSVATQMAARGFARRQHVEPADLVMDYKFRFNPEEYADLSQKEYGWVWQRGESGEVVRSSTAPDGKVTLERATLVLVVFTGDKSNVLWEIEASRLTNLDRELGNIDTSIDQVITKIFKQFPDGGQ